MVDFTRSQATAARLIRANGRKIALRGGPLPDLEDIYGSFVSPNAASKDGLVVLGTGTQFENLIRRSQEIIIAATGSHDILNYTVVDDPLGPIRGGSWYIVGIQLLWPGEVGVLSYIGVRR